MEPVFVIPDFKEICVKVKSLIFSINVRWNSRLISSDMKCPGDSTCSNQGTCDVVSTGTCICDSGFQGDMCQGKICL